MLKPRDYQVEAYKWALAKKRAVVCMPTGTGKTLVAGLWIKELVQRGLARKVLLLEPTRFLVEQTARFLRAKVGLDARPLHGSLPVVLRSRAWEARVVVATPEVIVSEWSRFTREGFDALVVDECHHTTGQDPYKVVVRNYDFKYRLGLTALVPRSRKSEVESYIGEVRCWDWTHPSIAKYMPQWAAEIYEAPFNSVERRLYESMEALWEELHGAERALLGNAIRWYARDGAAALRETLSRSARLRRLLGDLADLAFDPGVRDLHKLGVLTRILEDHEGFNKAIVFVDRVVVADLIHRSLPGYRTSLILGRRRVEPRRALEMARRSDTRVVIASSAGEEGIDLPEVDLLVLWSNTASPLRFVQRLGRLLRPKRGGGQKYVAFIVTPDTVDVDSLIDGIVEAGRAGVYVPVEASTVRYLVEISRRRKVLDVLYERPMTVDLIAQALQARNTGRIEAWLRWLGNRGYVAYIYTPYGRVYFLPAQIDQLYKHYTSSLTPKPNVKATITPLCDKAKPKPVKYADYERALNHLTRTLEKCGGLKAVRASVLSHARGLVRMRNLSYNYLVTDNRLVKVIVDNIYSDPATP